MANPPAQPRSTDVAAFLDQLSRLPAVRPAGGRGRLLFGLDATASRQPTWDRACHLTAEMFAATRDLGGLSLSVAYWRGYQEFAATPWLTDPDEAIRRMSGVRCLGGMTQIGRLLRHALEQTRQSRVAATVLVGDAVEEDIDAVCNVAGELGVRGTPVFCFQEGALPMAETGFRQIARVSGGAFARFDSASAAALRDLLRAVAVFAAGGAAAMARLPAASPLLKQLPGRR
jgi:hypothetical protein